MAQLKHQGIAEEGGRGVRRRRNRVHVTVHLPPAAGQNSPCAWAEPGREMVRECEGDMRRLVHVRN